jgi:hypothetical protein
MRRLMVCQECRREVTAPVMNVPRCEEHPLAAVVVVDACECGLENPGPEHRSYYPMLCRER